MTDSPLLDVLEESRSLGFLGPGDLLFHVEHAHAFGARLADGERVLDLGTGGGVPGIVLAYQRPRLSFSLLDANVRRCEFVLAAAADLGLDGRVDVLEGRAELFGRRPELRAAFDAVVSRSFGAPAVTAECAAPFLKLGGRLLVSEPPDPTESRRRWPADGVEQLGLRDDGRHDDQGFGMQVLTQIEACPDRFPRRVGVPSKRPLFG